MFSRKGLCRGFTLVETAIALGLLALVMLSGLGGLIALETRRQRVDRELSAHLVAQGFLEEALADRGRRLGPIAPIALGRLKWVAGALGTQAGPDRLGLTVERRVSPGPGDAQLVRVRVRYRFRGQPVEIVEEALAAPAETGQRGGRS